MAQRPTFDGKVVLFGNLHAHSSLSDDTPSADTDRRPLDAFTYAHEHGLDFLGISDHHKATDSPHPLRLSASEYQDDLFDVAMQFNTDHPGEFIAVPGIEWGNTATGNHVGVYGAAELPPDTIQNDDYDELFLWARENAEFAQFNHPYSWYWKSNRDESVGNFGEALYPSLNAYTEAVDPAVSTLSIICSVAGGHISGAFRDSEEKTHRDMHWKHYGVFLSYLNKGFHVSPAANQDTHARNWGTVTAARTAVWADAPTYEALMEGLRHNRVYATEDDELAVAFQVESQGERFWMGETIPLDGETAEVVAVVQVEQGAGSDGDPINEGPYTVTVFSDEDGIGGHEAAAWITLEGVVASAPVEIPLTVVNGEYVFIHVTEQNGADNPIGDGADEFDNDTGEELADGRRDDMNDSAWTTPVWFKVINPQFVWSENSNLYHDHNCWVVPFISAANRRDGTIEPAGRTKHTCEVENPFE